MPSLTVKAFAELLSAPMYEYVRILHEQKYPKQEPQTFRTPFYAPALRGIRDYYRADNRHGLLAIARQAIDRLGLRARRENNHRVLDEFEGGSQFM